MAQHILDRESYTTQYHEVIVVSERKDGVLAAAKDTARFHEGAWNEVEYDVEYDVMVQGHLWKFSQEAGCKTIGYKWVPSGTSLRDQLLSTDARSLVVTNMNDLRRDYRLSRRHDQPERHLPQVQDDARFYGDEEQDFWGDNHYGRFTIDMRARTRDGEGPRNMLEFCFVSDIEA